MLKRIAIGIAAVVLSVGTMRAEMTEEKEQQFLYYYYNALRLFAEEQYEDAFHSFQFCYHINPDDAGANMYLGLFYEGMKQPLQALKYLKRAYELNPDEYWDRYAVVLFRSGGKAEAIRVLETAADRQPDDSDIWDNLRQAYMADNRYKQALRAQDEIDRIEGYNAYSALNRYQIYVLTDRLKTALREIEKYLKEDPTNLQFLFFRAELLEKLKARPQDIEKALNDVLVLDPNNVIVLNNYAYLLTRQKNGDLAKAELMSQRALQREPNEPSYLDTYAWIMYLKGEYDLAYLFIKSAIDALGGQPISHEIRQHLTAILRKRNK